MEKENQTKTRERSCLGITLKMKHMHQEYTADVCILLTRNSETKNAQEAWVGMRNSADNQQNNDQNGLNR